MGAAALMRKASQTLFWSERVFAGQLMQECVSEVAGSSACLRALMCVARGGAVTPAGGGRALAFRLPLLVSGHEFACSALRGVSVWSPRSDPLYSAPAATASFSSAANPRTRPRWPHTAGGQRRAGRFDP